MNPFIFLAVLLIGYPVLAMAGDGGNPVSSRYDISFDNAVHHEARIRAAFSNLKSGTVEFRMSRSSPGRYALHEFVKNIYDVSVTDAAGQPLEFSRPDPYSWHVTGHDSSIIVSYTLFANRADGTYSQIDETHAHLNIPATFLYVPELAEDAIEIRFNPREDLNWKIATQLDHIENNTYYADSLQYFMDSPVEISNHSTRSFDVKGQTINFVLHHDGTEAEFDRYFEQAKAIVMEQESILGEIPRFDYGAYYFLACYLPHVSGDGMEHRNSTILTSKRGLSHPNASLNLGTVSHEFFHVWNVERIRPKSLEPFDFSRANMSGELWFAEGFTDYYADLTMCRSGIWDAQTYLNQISGSFNYVWNSPGRQFFNPVEMSYQAPFVDAATAVDPNNRSNTFISYYNYGHMLGLALDLLLREQGLDLDSYMKRVWDTFGKPEIPYEMSDLQQILMDYAGAAFGTQFFENYIYQSGMPDMKRVFEKVGVLLQQDQGGILFGASMSGNTITGNTLFGSPAYLGGLEGGDVLTGIDEHEITPETGLGIALANYKPGDQVRVKFERFGSSRETTITLGSSPYYRLILYENAGLSLSEDQKQSRADWLGTKVK